MAGLYAAFASSGLLLSTSTTAAFSEPLVAAGTVYITQRRIMAQNISTGINKHLKLRVQTQLAFPLLP